MFTVGEQVEYFNRPPSADLPLYSGDGRYVRGPGGQWVKVQPVATSAGHPCPRCTLPVRPGGAYCPNCGADGRSAARRFWRPAAATIFDAGLWAACVAAIRSVPPTHTGPGMPGDGYAAVACISGILAFLLAFPCVALWVRGGVPFVVDGTIGPDEVLSAEAEWAKEKR